MMPLNLVYGWMVMAFAVILSIMLAVKAHFSWFGIAAVTLSSIVFGVMIGELTNRLGRAMLSIGKNDKLIPLSLLLYVSSAIPGLVAVTLGSSFLVQSLSTIL